MTPEKSRRISLGLPIALFIAGATLSIVSLILRLVGL